MYRLTRAIYSESDVEAYHNQEKLQNLIEKVLADNTALKRKLSQSQDSFAARSIATRHTDDGNSTIRNWEDDDDNDDASTVRGLGRSNTLRGRFSTFGGRAIQFAFENILEQSRVYRRTEKYEECDRSFASTAQRSHAWSVFSGYSLADISVLSVIAMPLTMLDLANGKYYVLEGEKDNAESTSPTSAKTTGGGGGGGGGSGSMPPNRILYDPSSKIAGQGTALDEIREPDLEDQLFYDELFIPCKGCGEVSSSWINTKHFQPQSLT